MGVNKPFFPSFPGSIIKCINGGLMIRDFASILGLPVRAVTEKEN